MKKMNLKCDFTSSTLLFVGEGNFSFSASLAASSHFQKLVHCRLIASDYAPELDAEELSRVKVEEGGAGSVKKESFDLTLLKQNVKYLKSQHHQIFFNVDATKLHEHTELIKLLVCNNAESDSSKKLFVVFNFPHVKSKKMKIGLNRDLLRDFFISCDKLHHLIIEDAQQSHSHNPSEVIPIVSLCSGQSGIQEVEAVSRCWGDSWQVNDMAAHGNFVCTSICHFDEWDLLKLTQEMSESIHLAANDSTTFTNANQVPKTSYRSSLYRLQSGTSFTTENALTLEYQHRNHIDACHTSRLKSMLKFSCEESLNDSAKTFRNFFPSASEERIIAACSNRLSEYKATFRPYFHAVSSNEINLNDVMNYFGNGESHKVKAVRIDNKEDNDVGGEEVSRNLVADCSSNEEENAELKDAKIIIGKIKKDNTFVLYLDRLIELKHNCDYRTLLSSVSNITKQKASLYPVIHDFHISFWLSEKFTMDLFIEVLLDVYGFMLKSIEFVEEYVDKDGRISLCWKVEVQSLELPLSRQCAHQMYLQLRNELTERINVTVR